MSEEEIPFEELVEIEITDDHAVRDYIAFRMMISDEAQGLLLEGGGEDLLENWDVYLFQALQTLGLGAFHLDREDREVVLGYVNLAESGKEQDEIEGLIEEAWHAIANGEVEITDRAAEENAAARKRYLALKK